MPRAAAIPDATWQAIASRDRRADGRFVYGVASTKIFCRPSCPSRRPRRDRVRLFATAVEAEAGGFRACRRCQPAGSPIPSATARAIERARGLIDAHVDADRDGRLTLSALGTACGISPFHLQRAFQRAFGASPKAYADERRAARLRSRLKQGVPVTTATYDVGYGSSRAVYEQASRHLGMTPGAYRRGGAGERIRAVVTATPFGQLLVAATERGVCRVMLGDDPAALQADLAAEFPRADLAAADAPLRAHVAAIRRQLATAEGEAPPVDVAGTPFEQQVWRALRAIPYGEVRSYQQVAQAIGRPAAVRAVARACAANPVALVVPCHRVVRADGTAGGYRWGAGRKAALLAHERGQREALDAAPAGLAEAPRRAQRRATNGEDGARSHRSGDARRRVGE
jgi:AraC family transcriptional regulator of adaptative response/methylated-DNA-[protein]-cysteine methyltransferase